MSGSTAFYTLSLERTGWHIRSYTKKAPVGGNFLELFKISDADRLFIEQNIRENRREIFLLKSGERSVILSTGLYFSSGLLFAAVIDTPIGFTVALADRCELRDVIKAPSGKSADAMKRLSGEKSANVKDTFDIMLALCSEISVIPEANAFSLMLLMEEKAQLAARISGVTVDAENKGVFGMTENYDISLASAFFIAASAYVKRAGKRRTAKLSFFSKEERLYVSFECESLPDTKAFEFDILRYCADALDVGFTVTEENGKAYARLCSHRPDLSKMGLKNDIFFS